MQNNLMKKRVAIILGFYNGNKFLLEQLNSIIYQSHKNIKIFIFDDNSPEEILDYKNKLKVDFSGLINITKRKENLGYAKNFLLGLKEVGPNYDYYAFSDQDDIWEPDKFELALKEINKLSDSERILYCSRTAYYDKDCSYEKGSSRTFKRKPIFRNALIQNIAGGNTIVMNWKSRDLIVRSLVCDEFISHDWWSYQLISAAGGKIIFSPYKSVRYRQHLSNIIGENKSFSQRLSRLRQFLSGSFKKWNDINIDNLIKNRSLISKENSLILLRFVNSRKSKSLPKRLFLYIRSGVYRQTISENIIFIIGIILNKI